jgi:2-oxoglutarate ferredoxin oxidoreductase subunit delta
MKAFARTPLDLPSITLPRGQVFVIVERCKECDLCVEFCPHDVLQKSAQTNLKGYHYPEVADGKGDECVHCEFCMMICPEFAIFTEEVVQ